MTPTPEWYDADEDDADRVPAQNRTLTASQPSEAPGVSSGAQGSLVERLAEAIYRNFRDGNVRDWVSASAREAEALVAAEVEAAVSVVRAERDEARREADVEAENHESALARVEAAEAARDKARRDAEHWRTEANNGLDDQIASSDALLEMIARVESADAEVRGALARAVSAEAVVESLGTQVRALREKVAKVEAQADEWQKASGIRSGTYAELDKASPSQRTLWEAAVDLWGLIFPQCVHCGVHLRLDEPRPANPAGWGAHVWGSQRGLSRCGSESGQPYGLNGHTADASCQNPCAGTHVAALSDPTTPGCTCKPGSEHNASNCPDYRRIAGLGRPTSSEADRS